ncbi:MAG: amidohydrolase family protein, partial [Methanobacteriaceae archaeon]
SGIILMGKELIPQKANICIDDNGRIAEISSNVLEGDLIDATGCFISPGFVNSHVHIGDSFIMDCGDGKSIDEIVKPPLGIKHRALANADDTGIINAMVNSMELMVESGTNKFIDYRENGIIGIKLLKKAINIFNSEYADKCNGKSENFNSTIDALILGRDDIFLEEDPSISKVKSKTKKLLKHCDGIAPSGFGEISNDVAKIIVEECKKAGKISSIHAGENCEAQRKSIDNFGKSEIDRALSIGFNQLVHITNPISNSNGNISDLDLIYKFNSNNNSNNSFNTNTNNNINNNNSNNINNHNSIVLCPGANAILNLGIPPILDILRKGIKPLIGTDNIMLNSPNILNELSYTLKITRAYYKNYVAPVDILKMATTNICGDTGYNIDFTYNISNTDNNMCNVNNGINNSNQNNNKNSNKYSYEDNNGNSNRNINENIYGNEFESKIQNFMNNSIELGKIANLLVIKKVSKNPFLSIINRTESKDIIYSINNI